MTNSNRKNGTAFEREFCLMLAQHGFWAHNLAQNAQGQPFDVLVARNGAAIPVDCKVCQNNTFALRRMEQNQFLAMARWKDAGNGEPWFALKVKDGTVYMVAFEHVRAAHPESTWNLDDIRCVGLPFDRWVQKCM